MGRERICAAIYGPFLRYGTQDGSAPDKVLKAQLHLQVYEERREDREAIREGPFPLARGQRETRSVTIRAEELAMLVNGLDLKQTQTRKWILLHPKPATEQDLAACSFGA